MVQPLLALSGLCVSFRSETGGAPLAVVRDISFDVGTAETVAVVGESGSGKSVTSLAVMRLLDPASSVVTGRILLEGIDLLALPESEMRSIRGNRVAMIFQEPMTSLNPVYPIGSQIAESLTLHRGLAGDDARAEVRRLLDRVHIANAAARLHDYPHQFSGGMRQRVLIAMALACRPRLLIADEPTTALDVTVQQQILDLLTELQEQEGMSILFITHDMGVVAEIADRTVVMHHGEIMEAGTTQEIFAGPRHPYTRSLLAAVPQLGSMTGVPLPKQFPLVDKRTGERLATTEMGDTVEREGEPLLQVTQLTKRFPIRAGLLGRLKARVHAVEDISFVVRAGETLALVGESGCGKSTSGRAVIRLQEPDSGTVIFDGVDLRTLDARSLRHTRRKIQMIFQDPYASLNPRMTVGDAIAEPILVHRMGNGAQARTRAAELLSLVGLEPAMAERYPHEFSGGQRQRVCIARALAVRPRLIVADEAVSALDVSIKAQVCNLLLDLQASLGLAYVFISHDMAVVERMSHRVAIMYCGEIVEIGPRDTVFTSPQHPYTRRLLAAVPLPDPSRRRSRVEADAIERRSPAHALDYVAPPRNYREVLPGHFVQN